MQCNFAKSKTTMRIINDQRKNKSSVKEIQKLDSLKVDVPVSSSSRATASAHFGAENKNSS